LIGALTMFFCEPERAMPSGVLEFNLRCIM